MKLVQGGIAVGSQLGAGRRRARRAKGVAGRRRRREAPKNGCQSWQMRAPSRPRASTKVRTVLSAVPDRCRRLGSERRTGMSSPVGSMPWTSWPSWSSWSVTPLAAGGCFPFSLSPISERPAPRRHATGRRRACRPTGPRPRRTGNRPSALRAGRHWTCPRTGGPPRPDPGGLALRALPPIIFGRGHRLDRLPKHRRHAVGTDLVE